MKPGGAAVVATVVMALALSAAGAAPAEDDARARLDAGREAYAEGRYADAAEAFRLASFGLLDRPVLLSEALARLAVAENAANHGEEAGAAISRFLEVERRFSVYGSVSLEPAVRRSFHELLFGRVPLANLTELPGLADALGVSSVAVASTPSPQLRPTGSPPVTGTPLPTSPTSVPRVLSPTKTPTPRPATGTPTMTAVPPTRTRTATPPPTVVPPTPTSTPRPTAAPSAVPPTSTRTVPPPTRTATSSPTPVPPTATPTLPPPTTTPSPAPPTPAPAASPRPTPPHLAVPPERPTARVPVVPREQVDRPPVAIQTVSPIYPPAALRARLRGIVTLDVLVSETGTPLEVRVIEGARGGLTEAAVEAVRQWRFRPGTKGGAPVRTWIALQVPFEAIAYPTPTRSPVRAPTPTAAPFGVSPRATSVSIPPPAPPEPPLAAPPGEPASVYRTRRGVRMAILPEQARIFVDGLYVGIAADWDDRGGGVPYDFELRGPHRVRAELPGFEAVDIEVDVTQAADASVVAITDRLREGARRPYARLPVPRVRTRGSLLLRVDPPDASVSVNGQDLGPASAFSQSPLQLSGPAVHELHFASPARRYLDVRVLVSFAAPAGTPVLQIGLP